MKKLLSVALAAALTLSLAACGGKQTTSGSQSADKSQTSGTSQSNPQTPDGSASEPDDDEDYTTGDASLDNPRN